jgi:hypothetical protein
MKVEHLPYTTQGNAMTRSHKALSKWIYKDPLHKEQKDAHMKKKNTRVLIAWISYHKQQIIETGHLR